MNIRSQTMRMVLTAMMDTEAAWQRSGKPKDDMIDPDEPVVVQCGDYCYEIASVGGDGEIDGFVIMLKPNPVGEWRGMEYIKYD